MYLLGWVYPRIPLMFFPPRLFPEFIVSRKKHLEKVLEASGSYYQRNSKRNLEKMGKISEEIDGVITGEIVRKSLQEIAKVSSDTYP